MTLEDLYSWARLQMDAAGLQDWTLCYVGGAPHYLGQSNHGLKRITLSALHLLHAPIAEQQDTVLHEMAHALVDPTCDHDAVWRAVAKRLGALPVVRGSHRAPPAAYPVIGTCDYGCRTGRNRMPPAGDWVCVPHEALMTFTRQPKPPTPLEVTQAVALHGAPKAHRPVIGTTVRLVAPGHPLNGFEGPVTKLGRSRAYVDIGHPGGDVIIPIENVDPVG